MKVADAKREDRQYDRRSTKPGEGRPAYNISTANPYAQSNRDLLQAAAKRTGWRSSWWGTFNQFRYLGCNVRKGEKGTRIYTMKNSRPWYVYLFSLEQVTIPDKPPPELREPLAELMDLANEDEAKPGVMTREDRNAAHWQTVLNATGREY